MEQVRESLIGEGKTPSAVLDAITNEGHCFDLFDDKSPFLQDPSARTVQGKKRKEAGSLFAELATGTLTRQPRPRNLIWNQ